MKLDELKVTSFRCFGPDEVTVSFENGVTAFVGGNGSGKTAVFQALARLFGVSSRQRAVQKRDFHLSPEQPELVSGSLLVLEAVFSFPELDDLDEAEYSDAVSEFFLQMAASGPTKPLKVRMRLEAKWIDDGTPDGSVEEDIRWVRTLDGQINWSECKRVQAAQRSTIQLIYVPATRDADSQVTTLLRGRLWKAARWSQNFQQTVSTSIQKLQESFKKEDPAIRLLTHLAARWKEVHEADTDTKIELCLVENRFEELVRNAMFTFSPDEGGAERALGDLSDGQRSLFHIALTAATLEVEQKALQTASEESPFENEKLQQAHLTLLAIEEPENSLSPFFLSRTINQARAIAMLSTAQVALSSHAPAILGRIEPDEVRYVRLDRKTRRSTVKEITLPENDSEAGKFVRLAVRAYPELYFARFVILGEGDSERIVIQRVAKAMGVDLDPAFVPIVPLAGRYVGHFWRLLSTLDIPFATLLDFDLGRKHGGANLMIQTVKHMSEIKNKFGTRNVEIVINVKSTAFQSGWNTNKWREAFAQQKVHFSYPLDIDFAMLHAFGNAYKHPSPSGSGPRTDVASIQSKKSTTLKCGGDLTLYGAEYNDTFAWYPYLFLSRSKPETHNTALARINPSELAENAPSEIKDLILQVKIELERR